MVSQKSFFPIDIFAVKEYGIEKWQSEFFWPVSDSEFTALSRDIDQYFLAEINNRHSELGDLLLIISSLRGEYSHFLHAVDVVSRLMRIDKNILSSERSLWYRDILNERPIPLGRFRKDAKEYGTAKKLKIEAALLFWRALYNGNMARFLNPQKKVWHIFGAITPLMKRYINKSPHAFNFTTNAYWSTGNFDNISGGLAKEIETLSKAISDNMRKIAQKHAILLNSHQAKYLEDLTSGMLMYAADLMGSIKEEIRGKNGINLLTSTFVSLFPRTLCVTLRKNGGRVITFNHGGDIGIYDSPTMSFFEFAVADEFITYTKGSIGLLEKIRDSYPIPRNNKCVIKSCNSDEFYKMWQKNKQKSPPEKIKRVMFIGYPHNQSRKYHAAGSLSLMQLNMELRIVDCLKRAGYEVLYKAHPERLKEVKGIFDGKATVLEGYFEDCMEKADAFLFGSIRATPFSIALCTKKPMIAVSIDSEQFKPHAEAMDLLKKRCAFIKAGFDERNRIVFDEKTLLDVLAQKPGMPNTEFIERYMFP